MVAGMEMYKRRRDETRRKREGRGRGGGGMYASLAWLLAARKGGAGCWVLGRAECRVCAARAVSQWSAAGCRLQAASQDHKGGWPSDRGRVRDKVTTHSPAVLPSPALSCSALPCPAYVHARTRRCPSPTHATWRASSARRSGRRPATPRPRDPRSLNERARTGRAGRGSGYRLQARGGGVGACARVCRTCAELVPNWPLAAGRWHRSDHPLHLAPCLLGPSLSCRGLPLRFLVNANRLLYLLLTAAQPSHRPQCVMRTGTGGVT